MTGENHRNNKEIYEFGPFRLDAGERRLARDGQIVELRPKAFELLLILVREARHVKSRDELIEALWPDTIVEEHNLTVNINLLRKLLGDDRGRRYIETVRGYGYRFIAEVTQADNPAAGAQTDEIAPEPSSPTNGRSAGVRKAVRIAPAIIIVIGVVLAGYLWLGPSGEGLRPTAAEASIAVLPFENLSTDQRNAYFVRGIQDLIITKLAGIGTLKVISRTSTEHYASHPRDIRKIARELGVTTILEGSIQRDGSQVLINLQLIDAKSGGHIWAQAYTRKLDNVFDVESKVAQDVAAALKLKLFPQEEKQLAKVPTDNPRAYDLFLRANYLAAQVETRTTDDPARTATQAEDLYRQALALDPDLALAQARLSILDSYVYWYDVDHSPVRIKEARQAAAAAIRSGLPQGHLAMGYVYYRGYRDYDKALEEFKQTRRLLPNNVEALGAIAFVQRRQGEWGSALDKLRQASLLDPRNPLWHQARGETLAQLRRYSQAIEEFDHAFSIAPQYYLALIYKVYAQMLDGNLAAARHSLKQFPPGAHARGMYPATHFNSALLAHNPDEALAVLAPIAATTVPSLFMVGNIPTDLLRARAWTLKGDSTQARQYFQQAGEALAPLLEHRPDNPDSLSFLGLTEAALGNGEAAIRAATRAVKLLPTSKDAFYGPSHLTTLAMVYARTGKSRLAIRTLKHLLSIPAGLSISIPLLKLDPAWDTIRHDPAFQALLK